MRLILEECPYCGAEPALDKRDRRIYIDHESNCPCAEPYRTYFPVDEYLGERVAPWEEDIRTCTVCARKLYATGKSRSGPGTIYCSYKCAYEAKNHRYRERKKKEAQDGTEVQAAHQG